MIKKLFGKKKRRTTEPARPLVVMVDDEPDLCLLVTIALEHRGYDVATAYDGEAGLALIQQRRPAVVLLDIRMPKLNGCQVLARMQQDPTLAATPVIVMTSVSDEKQYSEEEWARRMGVACFLAKPFEPDTAADVVVRLLSPSS
jgi:chemosensory pili system protein ChpA (sensor histidine kinase/response regulator)